MHQQHPSHRQHQLHPAEPRLTILGELQELPPNVVGGFLIGGVQKADMAGESSPHLFTAAESLHQAVGSIIEDHQTHTFFGKLQMPMKSMKAPTDAEVMAACEKVLTWETSSRSRVFSSLGKQGPLWNSQGPWWNPTRIPLSEMTEKAVTGDGRYGVADQTSAQRLFELAELEQKKAVFVGGHSQWFRTFFAEMPKSSNFTADQTAWLFAGHKDLASEKLNNAAVVRLRLKRNGKTVEIDQVHSVFPGFSS
jgi:hypothetical protein